LIHAGRDGINLTGQSTGSLHPRQHKLHFKKINCCKLHRDNAMAAFINKLFCEVMLKWRTKVQCVANTPSKNFMSNSLTASGHTSVEDRCQQCKMRIAKQFHDVTPSPTDQHELMEQPASSFGKAITSVLSKMCMCAKERTVIAKKSRHDAQLLIRAMKSTVLVDTIPSSMHMQSKLSSTLQP